MVTTCFFISPEDGNHTSSETGCVLGRKISSDLEFEQMAEEQMDGVCLVFIVVSVPSSYLKVYTNDTFKMLTAF